MLQRGATQHYLARARRQSVWQSMPELTLPLQLLSGLRPTTEMISTHTPILQKSVQKLYGVSGDDIRTVDAAQLSLHKGRDFDHMPPSSDAHTIEISQCISLHHVFLFRKDMFGAICWSNPVKTCF